MILGRLVWRLSVDVSFFCFNDLVVSRRGFGHPSSSTRDERSNRLRHRRGACRKGNYIEAVSMRAQESRPVCPNSDGFIRSKYSRDGRKTTYRKNQ